MTTRRAFLAGLVAASTAPRMGWAAAGSPDFLSAARFPDGGFRLVGLTAGGDILFTLPMPDRGHAAAAHPTLARAVAFARRPGDFALVIDCVEGRELARLTAPEGRHFYGHGVFSTDGNRLYTTENNYENAEGMVGVWEARTFARLGEFPSGGVGPHDMVLMPDGRTLAVANGGIETHPDAGRAKLNIPMMEPNLAYLNLDGDLMETVTLDWDLHKNSIRHLAVAPDGQVAFAMQWQGGDDIVPLLGLHGRGSDARLLRPEDTALARMNGYAGSVAYSGDGGTVAITSPRGGLVQLYDRASGALIAAPAQADVCGLGTLAGGFLFTTGEGVVGRLVDGQPQELARHDCQWDNHLVALPPRA